MTNGKSSNPNGVVWVLLAAALVAANWLVTDPDARLLVLRVLLGATAAGELLAFVSNSLRPRQFAERCGRPYDPAYHGVMQDFGFYNLGFALLLGVSAFDPARATIPIGVVIAIYVVHAGAHLLRYLGVYFGGGHAIPTRPRGFELRDGLQLLAPAVGLALFFP